VIKGVNLGYWLVLEKWMGPELFAGTTAEDERQLCLELDDVAKEDRLRSHRSSFITEEDFAYLAEHDVDMVRIPVPFFIFGGYEPYVGCIEYLDQAFDWAETHGLRVLIDLHTVPDGQNGFDNGGICGVCKWHKDPGHVEFALTVLEGLTSRYQGRRALWGIEVLNEPISQELWDVFDIPKRYPPHDAEYARGSEPVPTGFLKDFYTEAYRRIRVRSATVTIVFHDGFRIREWDGFFDNPDFEGIVVDTHLYLMEHTFRTGDDDLDGYLAYIRDRFEPVMSDMTETMQLIVGEWCVNTMSPSAAALTGTERATYHRALAEPQLNAWKGSLGWFYWSYKLLTENPTLDGWSLRKSIEHGYLPPQPAGTGSQAPIAT
jgi:glucan 1,3-beta-glucosidase